MANENEVATAEEKVENTEAQGETVESNEEPKVVQMNTTEENKTEEKRESYEERTERMDRECRDKAVIFDTAYTMAGLLTDYMNSIVNVETRTWSKLVGISRHLESIILQAEKEREDLLKKYACLNEEKEFIFEDYEMPLPANAPEGMKPQIGQRIVYPSTEVKDQAVAELKTFMTTKTYFLNYIKMDKSNYMKVHINPQQFKSLDLVAKFFVK